MAVPASLGIAGAHEEPVRPGVEARRVAELREVAPDGEQRLLRRVLGEIEVAQNSVRDRVEPIPDGNGKAREGLFVAALRSSHEIGIHASPLPAGSHQPAARRVWVLPSRKRLNLSKLHDEPMETWTAINTIRVVREFANRPIEPDHLDRILNAGRRTGSSKNQQDWAFIVLRDRAHLTELAEVGHYAGHLARATVAVALVTPDPRPLHLWDMGRAAQNMVLAAWELGIGSVPATVYEHELVRRLLGLPDRSPLRLPSLVRHPADVEKLAAPNRAGGRLELSELVHEERW